MAGASNLPPMAGCSHTHTHTPACVARGNTSAAILAAVAKSVSGGAAGNESRLRRARQRKVTTSAAPGGASSVPAQIKAAVTDTLKLSALK